MARLPRRQCAMQLGAAAPHGRRWSWRCRACKELLRDMMCAERLGPRDSKTCAKVDGSLFLRSPSVRARRRSNARGRIQYRSGGGSLKTCVDANPKLSGPFGNRDVFGRRMIVDRMHHMMHAGGAALLLAALPGYPNHPHTIPYLLGGVAGRSAGVTTHSPSTILDPKLSAHTTSRSNSLHARRLHDLLRPCEAAGQSCIAHRR